MQIIIVQAEIETAIRNYVLGQLNVKDGHRIDIDLSATRGADGFKATIDIVPEDAPSAAKAVAEQAQAPAAVAVVKKDVTATKKESPELPKQPTDKAADTKAATPVAETQTQAGQDANAETGAASGATADAAAEDAAQDGAQAAQDAAAEQTGATEGAAQEPAEQPAAAPAKSLFAGLKRPVNTPAS